MLIVVGLLLGVLQGGYAAPRSGVIIATVVSLHKYPSATSETVTQALMSEPVRVLAAKGRWLKVALPAQFDYSGWLDASTVRLGAVPPSGDRAVVKKGLAHVQRVAEKNADVLTEAALATVLQADLTAHTSPGWTSVVLPDGRKGFVHTADVEVLRGGAAPPPATAAHLLALARLYTGTAYVWGGMSVKGIDCSGFTHTVYRMCGIKIHRDADQQFDHDGVPVTIGQLRAGDLIFFKTGKSDLITHVGFYVGDGTILHASSKYKGVTLTRLSESYLQQRIAGARRILP